MRYITVSDTETSGLPSKGGKGKEPVLAFHDILLVEVAAVVIDIWDMKIVDEYDVIIKPYVDKYVWQPQAEATHGLSQDHLFKNGVDIKEAYRVMPLYCRSIRTRKSEPYCADITFRDLIFRLLRRCSSGTKMTSITMCAGLRTLRRWLITER